MRRVPVLSDRLSHTHIPALDGLRGISALMVVVAHRGFLPHQFGALGVAIFFVLSGFLITWLLIKEQRATQRISLRDFYIRRTLRIFPAFYVYWGITVGAFLWMGREFRWTEVMMSFFYMGDYYSALKYAFFSGGRSIMGITWSLGVEEKFYLCWPFVFSRFRHDPGKLLRIALAVIAGIWTYRIVAVAFFHPPQDYLRYAFEARLDNIMYGCALALAVKCTPDAGWIRRLAGTPWLPVVTAAALIAAALFEERAGANYHYALGMSLDSILIVCLFVQLITWTDTRYWRWLESPIARFFGRISYSLYLYHPTVYVVVERLGSGLMFRYQILLSLLGSIAAATASYRWVEKPFLRLKERFAVKTTRPEPAATASAAGRM